MQDTSHDATINRVSNGVWKKHPFSPTYFAQEKNAPKKASFKAKGFQQPCSIDGIIYSYRTTIELCALCSTFDPVRLRKNLYRLVRTSRCVLSLGSL
jgi:hypothetical protein